MKKTTIVMFSFIILFLALIGCENDYDGYYDLPKDLEGPLYEQLKANAEYSSYVAALEKVPELASIINKSGLYTVFVPNNTAWAAYLNANGYSSSDDIPADKLKELVENHILFAMWYRYDFDRKIRDGESTNGDITSFEVRSRPALSPVIASEGSLTDDIGSASEGSEVKVFHNYRQMKVYTSKHLDKMQVRADYEVIYGVKPNDFHFGEASVLGSEEVDAKNGVIHEIDKVVEPVDLISGYLRSDESISLYNDVAERFMELDYSETVSQEYGEDVYSLKFVYPTATNYTGSSNLWGTGRNTWSGDFFLSRESAMMTVFAPTNESLSAFLKEKYIPDFASVDDIPDQARFYILAGSIYRTKELWPSDLDDHLTTISRDSITRERVFANPNTRVEQLSNGLLYIGDFMVPRTLRSVTALCLLDKDYEWTGHAVLNVLPEEESIGSSPSRSLFSVLSDDSDAADGKFTYLTPSNQAWANYGFTFDNYEMLKPEGSIMNNMNSPKLWLILKSHALLGAYDKAALEAGTLDDGYYLTASRLYIKYKNGSFLGYNRNTSKVNAYTPNLVQVNAGTARSEVNGVVVGVNGIIDLDINKDNSFFILTENKKAQSDLSYKPFMDKCSAVNLFQDGEIDYKDDFNVQNLTVFALTSKAIAQYNTKIANRFSALPNKTELDSVAWTNDAWRRTLKGHFVWDPGDPYKRIFLDSENFTGGTKFYTQGVTFYRNTPLYVSYQDGKVYISRNGEAGAVQVGIDQDGAALGTALTAAMNVQCLNAVVHIVDQVLPLAEFE